MSAMMMSLSLVLAAVPGVAAAQHWDRREVRSIRVDASALDLSTPAGVDELHHRVRRAVDRICGGDRECRDEAWASTDAQVDYAIARDEWIRRLAAEREAELAACGGHECAPAPAYPQAAYYAPPPAPPMPAPVGVSVTIIYAAPPPAYYPAPAYPAPRPNWQN